MQLKKHLFLSLFATAVWAGASAFAQYGSSGQTTGSGQTNPSPSRSSSQTNQSGAAKSNNDETMFTVSSVNEGASTITVRATGQEFSGFQQGQEITLNPTAMTSAAGKSDQTPSRGNEPYGQAKKDLSGTIVSIDQNAKTMTLRLSGADSSGLKTGTTLGLRASAPSKSSIGKNDNGTQGLSDKPSPTAAPSTQDPSSHPPAESQPERQSAPQGAPESR